MLNAIKRFQYNIHRAKEKKKKSSESLLFLHPGVDLTKMARALPTGRSLTSPAEKTEPRRAAERQSGCKQGQTLQHTEPSTHCTAAAATAAASTTTTDTETTSPANL